MRRGASVLGVSLLAVTWLGPWPDAAAHSFAAHMTRHITVVAIAAPLIAMAIAGTRLDPVRAMPRLVSPIPASMIELVVVWGWHLPVMHQAARHDTVPFVLEQGSFALAGVLLWIAALGGDAKQLRERAGAGIVALLFTSMHMTLVGALFALATRPLFQQMPPMASPSIVTDQQLGGVIMLLVGGLSYLAGGLWLTAVALRSTKTAGDTRESVA
jgi:putative membrane protein